MTLEPPVASAAPTDEVEVRRSRRRRRTVSAYRESDGRVVVLVPARFTRAQEREWVDTMVTHLHRLVDRRGERAACFQFRKIIKWYSHLIRPPKELYHRLINLSSVALFDEMVAMIRAAGPTSPLPGHFEPKVPVPAGPIDKW